MKTMKLWRIAFMMLAALSLASCSSDDDDKDITKEIIMNVSAEPGVMYDLFDSMGEHPITGILVASSSKFLHGPMKVGKQLTSIIGLEKRDT